MKTQEEGFAKEERTVLIKDDFFVEVILGVSMTYKSKEEIKCLCKSKNIPVYEAVKKDFRFELNRMKVK